MSNIKLEDWSLWVQGTDKDGNVRKFRLHKPNMPNLLTNNIDDDIIQLGKEAE
jgi:hypothetical protein